MVGNPKPDFSHIDRPECRCVTCSISKGCPMMNEYSFTDSDSSTDFVEKKRDDVDSLKKAIRFTNPDGNYIGNKNKMKTFPYPTQAITTNESGGVYKKLLTMIVSFLIVLSFYVFNDIFKIKNHVKELTQEMNLQNLKIQRLETETKLHRIVGNFPSPQGKSHQDYDRFDSAPVGKSFETKFETEMKSIADADSVEAPTDAKFDSNDNDPAVLENPVEDAENYQVEGLKPKLEDDIITDGGSRKCEYKNDTTAAEYQENDLLETVNILANGESETLNHSNAQAHEHQVEASEDYDTLIGEPRNDTESENSRVVEAGGGSFMTENSLAAESHQIGVSKVQEDSVRMEDELENNLVEESTKQIISETELDILNDTVGDDENEMVARSETGKVEETLEVGNQILNKTRRCCYSSMKKTFEEEKDAKENEGNDDMEEENDEEETEEKVDEEEKYEETDVEEFDSHLINSQLEVDLDSFDSLLDSQFDFQLDAHLDSLESHLDSHFDSLESHLDSHFDSLNSHDDSLLRIPSDGEEKAMFNAESNNHDLISTVADKDVMTDIDVEAECEFTLGNDDVALEGWKGPQPTFSQSVKYLLNKYEALSVEIEAFSASGKSSADSSTSVAVYKPTNFWNSFTTIFSTDWYERFWKNVGLYMNIFD